MKKALLTSAILLALYNGTAAAAPRGDVYPEQDWGTAIGSVFGVIVGGPAGLIVGGVAGSVLGQNAGLERELRETKATPAEPANAPVAAAEFSALSEPAPDTLLAEAIGNGFGVSVLFRTDREDLEPVYERQLSELGQLLANVPGLQAEITGRADARGTEPHNLRLAERRVQQIKQLLERSGFQQQAISESVLGEQGARSVQDDPQGLMFDRRVEIQFSIATPQGD